jgi:hypothetical protein
MDRKAALWLHQAYRIASRQCVALVRNFGLISSTCVRCNKRKRESIADMAKDSFGRSHRYLARFVLLLLVAIPLLPEIVICAVAGLAGLMGCRPDKDACLIGSLAVSNVIDWALWAGGVDIVKSAAWRAYFYLAIGAWLVVCYVVLIQGWERVTSRLLLGSAVALFFALLPFWGPLLAIKMFANEHLCKPENTGCMLFGGKVDNAYAALEMSDLPNHGGALPAVGIFFVFAVFVTARGVVSARRAVKSERGNF